MDPIKITLSKIGNSLGFILPQEATQLLEGSEGNSFVLTKSPDGIRITPYDPKFHEKMKVADSIMDRYKNALQELAK